MSVQLSEKLRAYAERFAGEPMLADAADFTQAADLIDELYEALDGIQWDSADKDNMEFAVTITYSRMDRINAALRKAREQS